MSPRAYRPGPVHRALISRDLGQLQAVLASGQSPDERDDYGRTSLMYAALDSSHDLARALLDSGADPNARDNEAWCALHFAAQSPRASIFELLIRSGAALDCENNHGNTPLWIATMFARQDLTPLETLLRAGANPDVQNKYGVSARGLLATTPEGVALLARHAPRAG